MSFQDIKKKKKCYVYLVVGGNVGFFQTDTKYSMIVLTYILIK